MLLAADYPFLNIFWTMIIFFTWVCWIMLVIRVFADIFVDATPPAGRRLHGPCS